MDAIMASAYVALGLMNVAKIAVETTPKKALGGYIAGPSHAAGGVLMELEGGETSCSARPRCRCTARGQWRRSTPASAEVRIPGGFRSGDALAGPRAAAGGLIRAGSPSKHTIVNFLDPAAFRRFLNSSDGKAAMVNHIGDHSFQIKQALGGIMIALTSYLALISPGQIPRSSASTSPHPISPARLRAGHPSSPLRTLAERGRGRGCWGEATSGKFIRR